MMYEYDEGSLFEDSPQDILEVDLSDDYLLHGDLAATSDALELETISAGNDVDLSDKLEYPCMVISGLATREEVEFFARQIPVTKNCLPLFIEFDGIKKKVGKYELSMEACQILRMIADYKVVIYRSESDMVTLDLNNEQTFINLLRI